MCVSCPDRGGHTQGASPRPPWKGVADQADAVETVTGSNGASAEAWLEEELAQIVGLERVKAQLRAFLRNLRLEARRREVGLKPSGPASYDMVFYGNPGTGKTSVARLVPRILARIGALGADAPFLEVGRSDLVGAFIGATEQNVQRLIEEARGGLIFVDEAYTLTPGDGARDFGMKALEGIMQCMTSEERDRPRFIFAGYGTQMESFLQANPGMARRIAYKLHFEDYTPPQLAQIAAAKAAARGLALGEAEGSASAALAAAMEQFPPHVRALWNGGLASRVIDDAVTALNARLDPETATRQELSTLQAQDVRPPARPREPRPHAPQPAARTRRWLTRAPNSTL